MPTNEYSRAEFLRSLLSQQRRNNALGGNLLNPSTNNSDDLETAATLDTTISGNTPINGQVLNFDVEKEKQRVAEEAKKGSGNWFLDALDNIFGFVDEVAAKFGAGFVAAWEGILDLGATAIGAFGDWTGWYSSDPFTKWAEQDISTQVAEWTKTYANLNPWSWIRKASDGTYSNPEYWNDMWAGAEDILDSAFFASTEIKDYREDADKYYRYNDEVLQDMGGFGEFLGGAAHSIGFMLPAIMTGGASAAASGSKLVGEAVTLGTMGLGAAGKGSEEALNEGASASQALGYGAATGAIEVASELVVGKALGVVGLGTGRIMGVVGEGTAKNAVKIGSSAFVKELGKTMFEEGMEEVFSAVMEPVAKSIYKGSDAYKGTYENPDWWFGTDGHFNESVLGQFTSGAFVGGLTGVVRSAPVYKKLGATNYNTMQSFRSLVEVDQQMAKMERKANFDESSKEYKELANKRAKAMAEFIEKMNTSLQKSSSKQNKYLAELLTNKGALEKAIRESQGSNANDVVNEYLKDIENKYKTSARGTTTSIFNEIQSRFGTNYDIEYLTTEELVKKYGRQGADNTTKGFFDAQTSKIVLNDDILNTQGGKVLAHEYFAHALSNTFTKGNIRQIAGELFKTEEGKEIAKQLKESDSYNFKNTSDTNIDFQEEVLGHYLERIFDGKNVATQLNNLKKVLGSSKFDGFVQNIIDKFNKVETFKSPKLLKEYSKVLNNLLKATNDTKIRKIVYKILQDEKLSRSERATYNKYQTIIDTLVDNVANDILNDFKNTLETQPVFSKDIDGNKYQVLYDKAGKPFERSPITYEGNKYILLPEILPAFPNANSFKGRFIDAFSGSLVVTLNTNFENTTANELNPYTYKLQKAIKDMYPAEVVKYIYDTIDKYQIRTEEGFNNFKKEFNETEESKRNPLDLFILQKASSSGSLLWFDENGNYKGTYTRSNFLSNKSVLKEEITKLHNKLQKVELTNLDAIEVINNAKSGDFLYVDPPYTNTSATYNYGWTEADDVRLMKALDEAASRGVGFAVSNVFKYNGKENTAWIKWAEKYTEQHFKKSYFKGEADEVLIKHKGDYVDGEINQESPKYRPEKNENKRFAKRAEKVFAVSRLYNEGWRANLSNNDRRFIETRLKVLDKIFSGESLIFGDNAESNANLNHYWSALDDFRKEGLKVIDKNGNVKKEYWTPEMHLLDEEYRRLNGKNVEYELGGGNVKKNYVGRYNISNNSIILNLFNSAYYADSSIGTIRHERTHYFQYRNGGFYQEYFEKPLEKLFKEHRGLLEELRASDPHRLDYYETALKLLKSGNVNFILDNFNDFRARRGLLPYTVDDLNGRYMDDVAMELNQNMIFDEILADTFALKDRVVKIYEKNGVSIQQLLQVVNEFRDAISKRYNVKLLFSKALTNQTTQKQNKPVTFKNMETTKDIVSQSKDYILGKLGSNYQVAFPQNFEKFVGKAFTEINSVKSAKIEAKRLVNLLLDTTISRMNPDTHTYEVVGTLDELLDKSQVSVLTSAVEGRILYALDTNAKSVETLPFEKSLDRAIDVAKQYNDAEGRNHILTRLRDRIRERVGGFIEVTNDNVNKSGLDILYNPIQELHTTGGKFLSKGIRNNIENVLRIYNPETIERDFPSLPYDNDIRQALIDFYDSLGVPVEQTINKGKPNESKRIVNSRLTANQMQKAIEYTRLLNKFVKQQVERDTTIIRPAVRQAVKTIENMPYGKRTNVIAKAFRMWKRGFAPAYTILEEVFGGNSELAKTIVYGMQFANNQKTLYTGEYADKIQKKLKELGIRKTLDTKTFEIAEKKFTADEAMYLYISLNVKANYDAINENGIQKYDSKTEKLSSNMFKGEADMLKAEVDQVLPSEYKELAKWLLTTMNTNVKADYIKMYEQKFGKYQARNEIGKIGENTYWMLNRSYQRMTNVEKAMTNPAGIFAHAKARVDTQNAVMVGGALSGFTTYVDQLGSELYIKPVYRNVLSMLNTKTEQGNNGKTVMQTLATNVSEKDIQYVRTTLDDILGANKSKTNDVFSKVMSTFSVAKLSLNVGTMLKQFASIWTSNIPMYKSIKGIFARWSPEARAEYKTLIDEIGGLKYRESSAGVLRANADSVGQLTEKIAKYGMIGISKVDLFTIGTGVYSLMVVAQDQYGYKFGTKENIDFVKENWTEFELSQIGHGALSKNAIARGDYGTLTKVVFGFLQGANRAAFGSQIHKMNLWMRNHKIDISKLRSEYKQAQDEAKYAADEYDLDPTEENRQNYIEAQTKLLELKNKIKDYEQYRIAGGKLIPVNMAAGLVTQGIFVALINELMRHIKGKKDWDEWDIFELGSNVMLAISVDWLPFVNTISGMIKGYDIQIPAVEIANEMVDIITGIKNGNWKSALRQIISLVGDMTGVPFNTLYDYAYGILKVFDPEVAEKLKNVLYTTSSTSLITALKNFVESGDSVNAGKIIETIVTNQRTGYISERVKNELTKLYMNGYSALPREFMTEYVDDNGLTVYLTAQQITAFKQAYKEADRAIRELLLTQEYHYLTQEEQAKLIKKIYDTYYNYAKAKVIGRTGSTRLADLLALTNGNLQIGYLSAILNKVSQIVATKRKTRKELVVEYINKQTNLTKQEKILAMFLSGYSLNEENKRKLKNYLIGKGASAKSVKELLN